MHAKHLLAIGASILLGLIFVTTGLEKLLHPWEFLVTIFSTGFFILSQAMVVSQWLPWIELMLGLLLIMGISAKFMASASCPLILGFIFYNIRAIQQGLDTGCGCGVLELLVEHYIELGALSSSTTALYLDIGMMVLVLIILVCYPGNFFTTRPLVFWKEVKLGKRESVGGLCQGKLRC